VRGQRQLGARLRQAVGEHRVGDVRLAPPGPRDVRALDIGALDEPHGDARGGEPVGVGRRAQQVGLQRGAHGQPAPGQAARRLHRAPGRLGLLRAELQAPAGGDRLGDLRRQPEVERDVRQVERQPDAGRRVAQPPGERDVRHGDLLGLLVVRHPLAEEVDARRQAGGMQAAGDGEGLVRRAPADVAPRRPPRPRLERRGGVDGAVEDPARGQAEARGAGERHAAHRARPSGAARRAAQAARRPSTSRLSESRSSARRSTSRTRSAEIPSRRPHSVSGCGPSAPSRP
jgi:hypothetical protein